MIHIGKKTLMVGLFIIINCGVIYAEDVKKIKSYPVIVSKEGTAGPYQKGIVLLSLKDYQGLESVTVSSKCSPKGINMHVTTQLFKVGDELPQNIKGPYQEADVVLNLQDYKAAKSIFVVGQCSPAGIAVDVSTK